MIGTRSITATVKSNSLEEVESLLEKLKNEVDKSKINEFYEDRNSLHLMIKKFWEESNQGQFKRIAKCVKLLLDNGCSPYWPNIDSQTPFSMLLNAKEHFGDRNLYKGLVNYFLYNSKFDVGLESEVIFDTLERQGFKEYPKGKNLPIDPYILRFHLERRPTFFKIFFRDLKRKYMQIGDITNENVKIEAMTPDFADFCTIYLTTAIKKGLTVIVEYLIDQGIDINRCQKEERPPAFIACREGYYKILELFLMHRNATGQKDLIFTRSDLDQNLLHAACENSGFCEKLNKKGQDSQKCFDLLLQRSNIKTEVNQKDTLGFTPLSYAIRHKNSVACKSLFRLCWTSQRDMFNRSQIHKIDKDILEQSLDECISELDGKISVDLSFLIGPKTAKFCEEIATLEDIANDKKIKPLILHPVFQIFLYLKWQKLAFLCFLNLLYCFIFKGAIVWYAFLPKNEWAPWVVWIMFAITLVKRIVELCLCDSVVSCSDCCGKVCSRLFCNIDSFLFCIFYLSNFLDIETYPWNVGNVLRGILILGCTFEFLRVLGDLPYFSLSTHMVILKQVFRNFMNFIVLYSIIPLGFASCFYILFEKNIDKNEPESNENNNATSEDDFKKFQGNLGMAIVKTFVMFTGELETSGLGLNGFMSCIIFLLFVLLVPIALFNLINGLSVADVIQIKTEGLLIDLCHRIHVLSQYEQISKKVSCLKNIIDIDYNFLTEGKITIDQKNRIELKKSESCCEKIIRYLQQPFWPCQKESKKFDEITIKLEDISLAMRNVIEKAQKSSAEEKLLKSIKAEVDNGRDENLKSFKQLTAVVESMQTTLNSIVNKSEALKTPKAGPSNQNAQKK